jgi:predicted amidohydrolase YtcJ
VRASAAPIRIEGFAHVDPREYSGLTGRSSDIDGGRFRLAGVKVFADGSFGGRTAALHSSYSDDRTIGEFLLDEETLDNTLRRCCDAGVTCAVHAIGDRALRTVLLAMAKFPSDTNFFRIEHAELTGYDEVKLLEYSPVYLSMQPNFVRNWQEPGGLYETRLGPDRWGRCNRFRTLADAGVPYMFGSDAMPAGPLFGLRGATHHPVEEERLGLAEALLCYSARAAGLGARPGNSGELVSGRVADLVVISGDIDAGDPALLDVDQTWVGGRLVFCGEGPNPADPA